MKKNLMTMNSMMRILMMIKYILVLMIIEISFTKGTSVTKYVSRNNFISIFVPTQK
jgi:hypothetical protein